MSPLRLNGSTSGYSQLDAPAIAGDQTFTLPGTGGTLDRLNRAGNILQVVSATYATTVTSSSSTFADTGLTATITPTSSASKILVIVSQNGCGKFTNNTYMFLRLLRGSTTLAEIERVGGANAGSTQAYWGASSLSFLDSPSTTSATTYKTQFASGNNVTGVVVQESTSSIPSTSSITLIEVAA
jgi:hypothetical protein